MSIYTVCEGTEDKQKRRPGGSYTEEIIFNLLSR